MRHLCVSLIDLAKFIEQDGHKAVITEAFKLQDKNYGTKITRDYDPEDLKKTR
jgi:carbamate kinase